MLAFYTERGRIAWSFCKKDLTFIVKCATMEESKERFTFLDDTKLLYFLYSIHI